jgi:hypothetical protein
MSKGMKMKTIVWMIAGMLSLPMLAMGGPLDPEYSPTNPASAMYTLEDLYNRAATGAAVTKRSSGFTEPSGAPTNRVGPTLDEILAVLPSPADFKGSAQAGDVPQGLTFWGLTADGWGVQTGTAAFVVTRIRSESVTNLVRTSDLSLLDGGSAMFTGTFVLSNRTPTVLDSDGHSLTVTESGDGYVNFLVPPGSGNRCFSLQLDGTNIPINIYVPNGNGAILGTTNQLWLSYDGPVITRVSGGPGSLPPKTFNCPTNGGITITIQGMNFGTNANLIDATIGGLSCSNVVLLTNQTAIACTLPANAAGGRDELVSVTVDGLNSGYYPYLGYAGPVISWITVNGEDPGGDIILNSVDGTVLNLLGSDFGTDSSQVSIKYGLSGESFDSLSYTATVESISTSQIDCRIGPCVGKNLIVQIRVNQQIMTYDGQTLTIDAPVIVPNTLRADFSAPGNTTLIGTSSDGDVVFFDANNIGSNASLIRVFIDETNECYDVSLLSSNTLRCTVPGGGSGGGHTFTVMALNNASLPGSDTFQYAAAPVIARVTGATDVDPATIDCPTSGGIWLTIEGEGFGADALSVSIGGQYGRQLQFISSTQIRCMLPPGMGKQVPVAVTCDKLRSLSKPYVSYASPSVMSVQAGEPARPVGNTVVNLPRAGGIQIALYGTNLGAGGGQVILNGMPCSNVVHDTASPHTIVRATIPPRTAPPYFDLPLLFIRNDGEMSSNVFQVSYSE